MLGKGFYEDLELTLNLQRAIDEFSNREENVEESDIGRLKKFLKSMKMYLEKRSLTQNDNISIISNDIEPYIKPCNDLLGCIIEIENLSSMLTEDPSSLYDKISMIDEGFKSLNSKIRALTAKKINTQMEGNYFGENSKGLKHGKGICIYKNHERYEGMWSNDLYEGFGRYYYQDGGYFIGEFRGSKKHGFGTFTKPDGWIYKGNWVDDQLFGNFTARVNSQIFHCNTTNPDYAIGIESITFLS